MDCSSVRCALSAALDGEDPALDTATLSAHLRRCPECRVFGEEALGLHRRFRLMAAPAVPDLSDEIMQALEPPPPRPVRSDEQRAWIARAGLCIIAVSQIVVAAPVLALGRHASMPNAAARHLAAFALALAVGLLVVAWRPERAGALLPVVGTLAGSLLLSSILNVAQGRQSVGIEVQHVIDAIGFALVWFLARVASPTGPGGRQEVALG